MPGEVNICLKDLGWRNVIPKSETRVWSLRANPSSDQGFILLSSKTSLE